LCFQSLNAVLEEAMREELSQQGKTTPNPKYQKLEQELVSISTFDLRHDLEPLRL